MGSVEAQPLSERADAGRRGGRVRRAGRALPRPRFGRGAAFLAPLTLLTLVTFDVPLALLLGQSVFDPSATTANYREVVETEAYTRILGSTLRVAAITTAICLLLGYPLALWLARMAPARRRIAIALLVLPFWVSILVRAYAWLVLLGNNGAVNRGLIELGIVGSPVQFLYDSAGVTLGTVSILLPFLVLPLYAGIARVDTRLLGAAASLGAGPATVLRRVLLPLTFPAALAGAVLVFVLTLGFFVTPAVLGGGKVPLLATLLDALVNDVGDWGLAAALSVLLLAATALAFALVARLAGRGALVGAMGGGATASDTALHRAPVAPVTRGGRVALGAIGCVTFALLVAPVLVVVPMSFSSAATLEFPPPGFSLRWYDALFSDATWLDAARSSALLALAASAIALVLGAAAAYGLARRRGRGGGLLLAHFVAPVATPTIITAVALYVAGAKTGLLGSWGGLLAAHVVLVAPFVVIVLAPAFRTVDERLERAAWSLGASRLTALRRVVLPPLLPSLLSAWLFAFLVSFDELVVTYFVAGTHETLPKRMFNELAVEITPMVTAVSTLLVALTAAALALSLAAGRRAGAGSPPTD